MKFVFVILHYKTVNDTIECIESILKKIKYNNFEIVVVDNNCPNPNKEILYTKYSNNSKYHILKNNKNLGFAKGNNKGYQYAKIELNANFIAMINNDTIFNQSDFIDLIVKKYRYSNYDILGPEIISTRDFKNQNPRKMWNINKVNTIFMIIYVFILYIMNFLGVLDFIKFIVGKVQKKRMIYNVNLIDNNEKEIWNTALHGSCLIFSPNYVKKFNGLYSNTFMYREEEILYYSTKILGLNTLYYPNTTLFHKEDSATNSIMDSDRKKREFQYINSIKSLKEVFSIVNDNTKLIKNITKGV